MTNIKLERLHMNTSITKSEQVELGFLLKWIVIRTIGWIVLITIGWSVSLRVGIPSFQRSWALTWLVCGVIGGAFGGILLLDYLNFHKLNLFQKVRVC